MADVDEYLAWKERRQKQEVGAASVVLGASDTSPDEAAANLQIANEYAKTTGSPTPPMEMVKEFRPDFQRVIEEKRNSTILSNSPKLSEWLRNPENATIARDDLESLSWWEQAAIVPRGIASALPAFNEGFYGVMASLSALTGAERASKWFTEQSRTSGEIKERVAGPTGGWFGSMVQGASQSIGLMAPGFLATAATGGAALPGVAAAFIAPGAITQGGESARRALDQGLSPQQAFLYGGSDAAAEALLAMIPVGRLLGDIAQGAGFGNILYRQIMTEVPTEVATTLFQNLNEYANLTPDKPFVEFLAEQPAAIRDTIVQTVLATGAVSGAGAGLSRIAKHAEESRKAKEAETRKAVFEAISGQAANSKLRARMPDRFRQFVETVTANGPVESLYIPADQFVSYFQERGVDPWELTDSLDGVTRDDLDAALAGNGDIVLPTATYAANIAGSEADEFFVENMRFSPDQMTAREAAEFNERAQEAFEEAWEEAERERQLDEELRSFEQEIYDTMASRLRSAGRSNIESTMLAQIYSAHVRTAAADEGLTIPEYLEKYPLPLIESMRPEGMQLRNEVELRRMLAAARTRRNPKQQNRGRSLLEAIDDYGGIDDTGGDIAAMLGGTVKPRKMIQRGFQPKSPRKLKRERGKRDLTLVRRRREEMQEVLQSGAGMFGPSDTGGKSHSIDNVAYHLFIERGYMADDPVVQEYKRSMEAGTEAPDLVPVLLEAIDNEIRGTPIYAEEVTESAADADLDYLEQLMSQLDVTLDSDDDAIIQAVRDYESQDARMYGQGGRINTESDAFKRWFGDSKVVDENGQPLVVYHGTGATINDEFAFDPRKIGSNFGFDRRGFFFTDDERLAQHYVSLTGDEIDELRSRITEAQASDMARAFRMTEAGREILSRHVAPVYLSIQRPITKAIVTADPRYQSEPTTAAVDFFDTHRELINSIADEGDYDGVMISEGGGTIYVAFRPEQIKSVHNRGTFDPNDPRILYQGGDTGGNRGAMLRLPDGQAVIRFFETADLSTGLHETGHFWLENLRAREANGSEVARELLASVRNWWRSNADAVAKDAKGVAPDANITSDDVITFLDNGTTGDRAKDVAIDVGMHEQFARGAEQYFMEGKSPTAELQTVFERFLSWLLYVYRKLSNLNVNISDDMRRVFDRMIATEAEIARAKEQTGDAGPLFASAEEAGMSPEEYARLVRLHEQASSEAHAKTLREIMTPIRSEEESKYKKDRERVRADVEREVNAYRFYRAIEWMGNRRWLGDGQPENLPDMRLSKDILVDRYGDGVLKTLPRGRQTVYAVEGGLDPDDVAGWFGFNSGDEMVRAMESAPPRKEAIEAETDKRMRELYGDPLNDGSISEQAIEAIHNEKRGRLLIAELNALRSRQGDTRRTGLQEIRTIARQVLNRMKVRDAIASSRFLVAERKAANEAYVAVADGDIRTASDAKYRQLLNHALYMESRKVSDEVEKAENFARDLGRKSKRQKIAGAGRRENAQIDYLAAIDEILDRYDFRRMSGRAEERRGALQAYIAAMQAAGRTNELAIPERVMQDATRVPYKTLPVEELRGVIDALRNLENAALRWNKLITEKRQREFEASQSAIINAIAESKGFKEQNWVKDGSLVESASEVGAGYLGSIYHASTILRIIDGHEDLGPAYDALKTDIDEASIREREMRAEAAKRIDELYNRYTPQEQRKMGVKVFHEALGASYSKWNLIAMALNMGNEGNLSRLTNRAASKRLTEAQVEYVKRTLDKRDWDFVQEVWDYIGSFRAEIAKRERRVKGIEPEWVEPMPVETPYGTYPGGYYPIKYEGRLGGARQELSGSDADILQSMMRGGFVTAATKDGHLQARMENVQQSLSLDIGVIGTHIAEVIHDLTHAEAVVNSFRLLTSQPVRDAFYTAGLHEQYNALRLWIIDAASGQVSADSTVSQIVSRLRSGFVFSKLAWNLRTMLLQPLGVFQSAVVVGKKRMARTMARYIANPGAMAEQALSKSRILWERRDTFNKDLMDALSESNIASPSRSAVRDVIDDYIVRYGMVGMTYTQLYSVDIPSWIAAYEKGLEQFDGNEERAIQFADSTLSRSQGSGLWSDRSGIERGTLSLRNRQDPFKMLFTSLGTFFFAKTNIALERTEQLRAGPITPLRALDYAFDMTLLFAAEAIAMHVFLLLWDAATGDDDDDDASALGEIAIESMKSLAAGLPFIRDVASSLSGFDGGTYDGMLSTLSKPLNQALQGDPDLAAAKSASNLAGMLFRLPSSQFNRALDALWRESEGEEVAPAEYLFGRSGK